MDEPDRTSDWAPVRDALTRIDPDQSAVIRLKHFEQLTTAEVAHELGIERAAASKRYIRALQRLEQVLREFGIGVGQILILANRAAQLGNQFL